ncbi:hypothetical protein TNCV_3690311 [Trichonephila clavipes]|uniref:Uncharacterized protein n=1 Tax=Trichonephila clavipes TaxID=2585209 RepID=A0A8X6VQ11_TRICX|nr:hypothetical protein TNCV_3690311 [Trichonephila clavipes]
MSSLSRYAQQLMKRQSVGSLEEQFDHLEKGRRATVNIDQVRVYHPRHSDTDSFDSTNETLYEGKGSSNGSSRSHPANSRSFRKPSGNESESRKSNKGTARLKDLRLKRKVRSIASIKDEEVHLKKRADEEQEYSLTRPERPGQHVEKDTVQLRGDQSGLDRRQQ